jgi:hypothetical protein
MRLVEYSDFGDMPEFRVEKVGNIVLVSPNIVRMTFVNADGVGEPFRATHHQFWDVGHWLAALPAFHLGRKAIEEPTRLLAERHGLN